MQYWSEQGKCRPNNRLAVSLPRERCDLKKTCTLRAGLLEIMLFKGFTTRQQHFKTGHGVRIRAPPLLTALPLPSMVISACLSSTKTMASPGAAWVLMPSPVLCPTGIRTRAVQRGGPRRRQPHRPESLRGSRRPFSYFRPQGSHTETEDHRGS